MWTLVVEHQGESSCECTYTAGKSGASQHYTLAHHSISSNSITQTSKCLFCYPLLQRGKEKRHFMLVLSKRWLEMVKEQERDSLTVLSLDW